MKLEIKQANLVSVLKNAVKFNPPKKQLNEKIYLTFAPNHIVFEAGSIDGYFRQVVPAVCENIVQTKLAIDGYGRILKAMELLEKDDIIVAEVKENEIHFKHSNKKNEKVFKFFASQDEISVVPEIEGGVKITTLKGHEIKKIWNILKGVVDKKTVVEKCQYLGFKSGNPGTIFGLNEHHLVLLKVGVIEHDASVLAGAFSRFAEISENETDYTFELVNNNIIIRSDFQLVVIPGYNRVLLNLDTYLNIEKQAGITLEKINYARLYEAVKTLRHLCGTDTTLEMSKNGKIVLRATDETPTAPASVEGKETLDGEANAEFKVFINISYLENALETTIPTQIKLHDIFMVIKGNSGYETLHLIGLIKK